MARKVGIHLAANALVLALGYYWLGIAESRATTLALSGVVALLAVAIGIWAYAASFVYRDEASTVQAWRKALRNVLPAIAAALVLALVYWLLARWSSYSPKAALNVASWMTLKSRKPVRLSASILLVLRTLLWLVRWVVLPVLLLPVIRSVVVAGWRGFRIRRLFPEDWRYWIATPLLLLCFLRLPLMLVIWVPEVPGFFLQSASFAVRASIAYLLFGAAWLALAFITSAGKPRETQPSTAVSP